jgi:hypothetical protein
MRHFLPAAAGQLQREPGQAGAQLGKVVTAGPDEPGDGDGKLRVISAGEAHRRTALPHRRAGKRSLMRHLGRWSGIGADAGGAELSERLGELVAQPLIVLSQFPVAGGGGLQPA